MFSAVAIPHGSAKESMVAPPPLPNQTLRFVGPVLLCPLLIKSHRPISANQDDWGAFEGILYSGQPVVEAPRGATAKKLESGLNDFQHPEPVTRHGVEGFQCWDRPIIVACSPGSVRFQDLERREEESRVRSTLHVPGGDHWEDRVYRHRGDPASGTEHRFFEERLPCKAASSSGVDKSGEPVRKRRYLLF
jgi:hypothetical protein